MLLKSCNRCKKLIPYGSAYCTECAPIVEAERMVRALEARRKSNREYNKKRDPKYVRFYNSNDWRTLSLRYTQDKGYKCERCGAIATDVHHKKAIQTDKGWELRLDYDNLELLCKSCHNEQHERFMKRRRYLNGGTTSPTLPREEDTSR